ncbi:MAG: tRNA (adenosine(37)-N6)-threonylcarbamoyltransferase complex dimerization subunit type 1 TsaB [Gammaproteobacteria bacterium]|nr:tRNA (adenosine(37)-N6)-threonylcarbamoyltransferase complex dimerization subunit type 1 TsaB [Gammaproteobacteria bacterium]
MPKILAIDTSTDACSAALLIDNKVADRFEVAPKQHTSLILSMIDDLLVSEKLDLNQLDAISFGAGPGSFTGVRLAASIVGGLALASNIPVIGVSTLRALAQEIFVELEESKVLVVQDARMQEVYWGKYQANNDGIMQAIKPDRIIKPDEGIILGDDFVGVGSGFRVYADILAKNFKIPLVAREYVQAKYLLQLAAYDFSKGLVTTADKAQPVYLREKVAWS